MFEDSQWISCLEVLNHKTLCISPLFYSSLSEWMKAKSYIIRSSKNKLIIGSGATIPMRFLMKQYYGGWPVLQTSHCRTVQKNKLEMVWSWHGSRITVAGLQQHTTRWWEWLRCALLAKRIRNDDDFPHYFNAFYFIRFLSFWFFLALVLY